MINQKNLKDLGQHPADGDGELQRGEEDEDELCDGGAEL